MPAMHTEQTMLQRCQGTLESRVHGLAVLSSTFLAPGSRWFLTTELIALSVTAFAWPQVVVRRTFAKYSFHTLRAISWPPRSKALKLMPSICSSSLVGNCVGACDASLASFSMCIRVVLPALSRPYSHTVLKLVLRFQHNACRIPRNQGRAPHLQPFRLDLVVCYVQPPIM
jgi:hypothetical protein